ncbi:MAG: nucleotide 5'-monophosphate nucleosidase PpnN [Pseudohongiella sp.]|nr:nucleotide 5'-monophosphate nucleosidase PpnN [Pseudohongiella sp.]MDO9518584.1 nucleotide 5'-monophosphate nucleosidase PpnN [Pseudohongiella sp.]MDP2127200.1 nucleotide 5'-monophosphate nucleosidase PpnN [Pseudohongiella sp.]
MSESVSPSLSACRAPVVDASISPIGSLELLSQQEVERLRRIGHGHIHELFRRCALAVLNCDDSFDSAEEVYKRYPDFSIEIVQRTRGIKLRLKNAPACAFVDGVIMNGVREHLFSVLRDIVFVSSELYLPPENAGAPAADNYESIEVRPASGADGDAIKNLVFDVLRNAGFFQPRVLPHLVVCWGGHAISREEYDFSKAVGYQLGLRGLDIITGCGPGAMKGPMKGATIGHAKQRISGGRYIGISEPGIIAAESPNPIVNHLVVMPDIEKRLEAFVRVAHGIIVFPGGVGTLEEILFLLGTLMDPANAGISLPVVFADSAVSHGYFQRVDQFLVNTLGEQVRQYYRIVEDDAAQVAKLMKKGMSRVSDSRRKNRDAYYYNWLLHIPDEMTVPFEVSHNTMAALRLSKDTPPAELVVNLRRAFSGIVAGNVKDQGVRLVREKGPFVLRGDKAIMSAMDELLRDFVDAGRMKLIKESYNPCYTIEPVR